MSKINHSHRLITAFMLMGIATTNHSAEIIGGTGLGFSNASGQWVANIVFNKADLTSGLTTSLKTGDDLTPAQQQEQGTTLTVPPTKSMSWCDPAANPVNPTTTDFNECYGWAMHAKWVVLDFNEMQKKGVKTVYLKLSAKRYNDNDNVTTDDDLIPALTVYKGRQDVGAHLHWFPNKFQKDPVFWAWKLSPFNTETDKTVNSLGRATAYGPGNQDEAIVTGKLALKAGGQNYLTVAIGGDAHHENVADKHDVNFQFDVQVSKKALSANSSSNANNGGATAKFDLCGGEIGSTMWHPAMCHHMAISLCDGLVGKEACQTPEQCELNKGPLPCL